MAVQSKDYEKRVQAIVSTIPSRKNRDTLQRFLAERRANGVKASTLVNHAHTMRDLAVQLHSRSFESCKKEDLLAFVNTRERVRVWRNANKEGTVTETRRKVRVGDSTLAARKHTLKMFFRWLRESDEFPPEVKWLSTRRPTNGSIPTDELVTPEDLRALLQAHPDPQHKAILAVLYESGLRAGELCSLNLGNVEFDEYGAVIMLPKKATGLKTGARRVRLFRNESVPYLHAWYENHPKKDNKKSPLFFSMSRRAPGTRMSPNALWQYCHRAGKKAKLDKDLKPHLFRHTAATNKAREGWKEAEMRAFFGWTRSSSMPATYVHLAGLDYEEMALERKGLKKPGTPSGRSGLAPRVCKLCKAENLSTATFCQSCRAPVSPNAEAELVERRRREMRELLVEELAVLKREDIAGMVQDLVTDRRSPK